MGRGVSGEHDQGRAGTRAYELHGEDSLVDFFALFGEASTVADRAAPRHVGSVAVPLGPGVDQDQRPLLARREWLLAVVRGEARVNTG
jgi:hypothetical protein